MILFKLMKAIARRRSTLALDREVRERRNLERFRELAAFVQQASPWYRRVIENHRIDIATCRPEDFPVLTTTMVRENLEDIVTDRAITRAGMEAFLDRPRAPGNMFLERYHVVKSSGSSGLPGYYVHTTDEVVNGMSYGIFHRRLKPRTRTTFIGLLSKHMMSTTVMGLVDRWPERLLFNTRNFDIRAPWTQTIAGLNAHRPKVVTAYKHILMTLAEEARAGRLTIKPDLIESGGEPLFRHEREFLRATFGCEIANSYGSSEINLMGVALNGWEGFYLFEDDLMFEIADELTCVTHLYNRTLPLIRYSSGDILTPVEVASPRLPFRVVSEAIRRSQEFVSFSTGDGDEQKFDVLFFEGVDFSGVRRVAFEKKDSATLAVSVVFIGGAGSDTPDGEMACEPRLEQIRLSIRQYLDARDLQGVQLEISGVASEAAQPESRLAEDGRKEKLILDAAP